MNSPIVIFKHSAAGGGGGGAHSRAIQFSTPIISRARRVSLARANLLGENAAAKGDTSFPLRVGKRDRESSGALDPLRRRRRSPRKRCSREDDE